MKLRNRSGQVIVEYVLLLVIAVALTALIFKTLASRGDEPGALIEKWNQIQTEIGKDQPEQ